MICDSELLQAYLDGELEEGTRQKLAAHVNICRSCRLELSKWKLLWLELNPREEISLPLEWPYLRQQVVAAAVQARSKTAEKIPGFWETQRVAWEQVGLATAYIPGTPGAVNLIRAAGRELPGLFLNLAGRLWLSGRGRGKEGGRFR